MISSHAHYTVIASKNFQSKYSPVRAGIRSMLYIIRDWRVMIFDIQFICLIIDLTRFNSQYFIHDEYSGPFPPGLIKLSDFLFQHRHI